MTCPICRRGDDIEHGRVLCQWRRCRSARIVRLAMELERHARSPEPGTDRLRLAWWVVRHAEFEWAGPWAVDLAFLARGSKRRARQYVDAYAYSAAQRDINRFAANRYALAALEALEPTP